MNFGFGKDPLYIKRVGVKCFMPIKHKESVFYARVPAPAHIHNTSKVVKVISSRDGNLILLTEV